MEDKKKNDATIIQLQNVLACKREELKPVGKQNLLTTCSFKYPGNNTAININTLTKVSDLLEIGAALDQQRYFFDRAVDFYNCTGTEFKWCGFSYEDWQNDIQIKIDKLNYQTKKSALDLLEKRLLALESDELKTAKELEALMAILNN